MYKNKAFILIESILMFFIACMIVFIVTILTQLVVSYEKITTDENELIYEIKEIYKNT